MDVRGGHNHNLHGGDALSQHKHAVHNRNQTDDTFYLLLYEILFFTRLILDGFLYAQSRRGEPAVLLQHIPVDKIVNVITPSLTFYQPDGL